MTFPAATLGMKVDDETSVETTNFATRADVPSEAQRGLITRTLNHVAPIHSRG